VRRTDSEQLLVQVMTAKRLSVQLIHSAIRGVIKMTYKYTYEWGTGSHEGEIVYFFTAFKDETPIHTSEYFNDQRECYTAGEAYCVALEIEEQSL
jgi:hypothetical protein